MVQQKIKQLLLGKGFFGLSSNLPFRLRKQSCQLLTLQLLTQFQPQTSLQTATHQSYEKTAFEHYQNTASVNHQKINDVGHSLPHIHCLVLCLPGGVFVEKVF
ncbi:unnamed protein product [Vicia faba]|uniref:Uncharacterized protein n=1 Tax=Vicia faba TaxID=3906 RepID=A0AAV0YNB7_VICFA|nr:unnamed protein product [Vicia faba]